MGCLSEHHNWGNIVVVATPRVFLDSEKELESKCDIGKRFRSSLSGLIQNRLDDYAA